MRWFALLLLAFALPAQAHSGGPAGEGYTRDEVEALSIVIQERLDREDWAAAISLAKRFIIEQSEDVLLLQSHGYQKHRLMRSLVQSPAWRHADRETQSVILKIALKYGPFSPQYERELLHLLARTGTLEAMAGLLGRALRADSKRTTHLPNSFYESILSRWTYAWHRLGSDNLLSWEHPVEPYELLLLVKDWLKRFSHPDQVVAQVNARTSAQTLEVLPLLLNLRTDWPGQISEQQANRLRYWQTARGCEDRLRQ